MKVHPNAQRPSTAQVKATHSHPPPPTATPGLGAGFDLNNFHNPGGLSQVLSLEVSIEADVEPPTSQIPAL
jgi:hypothetical protein